MSIAGRVTLAENEWLLAVAGPHAVELASIPGSLEEDHGDTDRVRRRASASIENDTHSGVDSALHERNVALVVWRIKVLSIPARWEEDVGTDTTIALFLGQFDGVIPSSARRRHVRWITEGLTFPASEGQGIGLRAGSVDSGVSSSKHWVTSNHSESLRESGDFPSVGRLDVVNSHSTIGTADGVVRHLRHPDEASVGVLEVHNSGPVVGLVLLELARRASGDFRKVEIGVHGQVEAISSNNLVDMGRDLTWRNQRVESLRHQLRAGETKESMRIRREEEG